MNRRVGYYVVAAVAVALCFVTWAAFAAWRQPIEISASGGSCAWTNQTDVSTLQGAMVTMPNPVAATSTIYIVSADGLVTNNVSSAGSASHETHAYAPAGEPWTIMTGWVVRVELDVTNAFQATLDIGDGK